MSQAQRTNSTEIACPRKKGLYRIKQGFFFFQLLKRLWKTVLVKRDGDVLWRQKIFTRNPKDIYSERRENHFLEENLLHVKHYISELAEEYIRCSVLIFTS
jgi:hypothetical protein